MLANIAHGSGMSILAYLRTSAIHPIATDVRTRLFVRVVPKADVARGYWMTLARPATFWINFERRSARW
jgi:hypothetical protein